MPRELRPRRARPDYAALFTYADDEVEGAGAGPSKQPIIEEDNSSSDFAPDTAISAGELDDDDDDDLSSQRHSEVASDIDPEAMDLDEDIDEGIAFSTAQSKTPKGNGKKVTPSQRSTVQLTPGLARPTNRQTHALPLPSMHHRHRSVPIYHRADRVERLATRPRPFDCVEVVPTSSGTGDQEVLDRATKAWGYNVGAGPLWDLMEDRGWYKEALEERGKEHEEASRRPRVHNDVQVSPGWMIFDSQAALAYLPSRDTAAEDDVGATLPSVTCFFGPAKEQQKIELQTFETLNISQHFPGSHAQVFNAGAPVWAIDWCPTHPSDRNLLRHKRYLAVGPSPSRGYSPNIGARVQRPFPACIQIWSLGSAEEAQPEEGKMSCEMVLCIDAGSAHELKWCPLPSGSDISVSPASSENPRKLGLLAGTFYDGSMSIYAVPYPPDVALPGAEPIYVNLPEPLLRIELKHTACWTLDWANSEVIAVGCTNGSVAVYDIAKALRSPTFPLLPTHYLNLHQSAIRALTWVTAPPSSGTGTPVLSANPTVLATGGYDGVECLTDIRDPGGNVMNRTRDVINFMEYSPYVGGVVTIDHENIVKAYSAAPTMLGRGHTLLEPGGPAWSASASAYHPQLAVGSSDGSCLTTNMSRSTRRGGAVPFLVHKIYQMDYSRKTGEYRMLEHFLPQETHERPNPAKAKSKGKNQSAPPKLISAGAWSPEVGVQRVAWNDGSGLAGASWLASATASGLCRVDWLEGRWLRDREPYGGVEVIRKEVAGAGAASEEEE